MNKEQILEDYRQAYRAANGRDIRVDYKNGWVHIGQGAMTWKKRIREVQYMTNTLRFRVKRDQQTNG